MYGAIIGDIIGSRFEFGANDKSKVFDLFTMQDDYTDDTVMSIAVCEALLTVGKDAAIDEIESEVKIQMQKWGHRYPDAGYGGSFINWLNQGEGAVPYNSYGNGSAMRVSAAGWLYDSIERTREVARATSNVTHNHKEGIKAAEATASAIYMARNSVTKADIKAYIESKFDYDLSRKLDDIRPGFVHYTDSMRTVPEALICFLEGDSYEDTIRNAISLGGDSDTLAAIAGSVAEAYYGIPVDIMVRGAAFIPDDMMAVLDAFDTVLGRTANKNSNTEDTRYQSNGIITKSVQEYLANECDESRIKVLQALMYQAYTEQTVPTPMIDINGSNNSELKEGMKLRIDYMKDSDGNMFIPLFTDVNEIKRGKTSSIVLDVSIKKLLTVAYNDKNASGVVINPFGDAFIINRDLLRMLFEEGV